MMYIQLHIVAGMEHAIDSFSINFYKDMDIEVALSDWNMVQATLRHFGERHFTTLSFPLASGWGRFTIWTSTEIQEGPRADRYKWSYGAPQKWPKING